MKLIDVAANMGGVRSLLTVILFLAFLILWAWAWSKGRKEDFEQAARLPLEDGEPATIRSPQP
jgi:cbb3-type cytochrome oxidase subunit 3